MNTKEKFKQLKDYMRSQCACLYAARQEPENRIP